MPKYTKRGDDLQNLEGGGGSMSGGSTTGSLRYSPKMDAVKSLGKEAAIGAGLATGLGTAGYLDKQATKAGDEQRQKDKTPTDMAKREAENMKADKKYSAESPDQKYAKGGMTASARADGCAQRGKTKGTMVMCGGGMSK